MAKRSTVSVDAAIEEAVLKQGLDSLKEKQIEAARSFAGNQDKFVCSPTGYGNPSSMPCYLMYLTN